MATVKEMPGSGPAPAMAPRTGPGARLRDYLALGKPRIVLLLLITAYCAMVVAAGRLPGPGVSAWTLFSLALTSGGANALNMWYDRDIDGLMERTRRRPLPAGRLSPWRALAAGLGGGVAGTLLAWLTVGPLAAALLAAGFVYYVLVYTVWLKRRTPQNIVIGGGAGAFPPLVGYAAVTGHLAVAAWVMFAIIFLWTPPHFWALALYKQADYRRARIPMMPVARGERATKRQMAAYAASLVPVSLLLVPAGGLGVGYAAASVAAGVAVVLSTLRLMGERAPEFRWARRTFGMSVLYLTVVFGAMVGDVLVRSGWR